MSYYYQGLTSNGVFYVSLIWPVSTESLPNTLADVPEEVNAQVANADSYAAYLQTTKDSLNALPTTGWAPDLAALDALVQSLTFPTELTPKLTGTTWQWVSLTTPVEQTAVSDPTRYTITFNDDGTAAIKADCNNVVASYTADGGSLSILPGPSTLAACPEDSLGDQFVANLSNAAIYFFRDGRTVHGHVCRRRYAAFCRAADRGPARAYRRRSRGYRHCPGWHLPAHRSRNRLSLRGHGSSRRQRRDYRPQRRRPMVGDRCAELARWTGVGIGHFCRSGERRQRAGGGSAAPVAAADGHDLAVGFADDAGGANGR
ncbi:MAG: META domain-containing protein [Chloroflexi bacterium]|nr:META domain-containing protein [Chloroflexota bacterium]